MIPAVDTGLGGGHDLVDHRDPAAVSRRLVSAGTGAARRVPSVLPQRHVAR
jgi:hypothetical protein